MDDAIEMPYYELTKKLIATGISQKVKEVLEEEYPELRNNDNTGIGEYTLELISNLPGKVFKKYKKEEILAYLRGNEIQKIRGWVARDGDEDKELCFFLAEPVRMEDERWWRNSPGCSKELLRLDDSMFPDLTWESGPIEVEMTIKKK